MTAGMSGEINGGNERRKRRKAARVASAMVAGMAKSGGGSINK